MFLHNFRVRKLYDKLARQLGTYRLFGSIWVKDTVILYHFVNNQQSTYSKSFSRMSKTWIFVLAVNEFRKTINCLVISRNPIQTLNLCYVIKHLPDFEDRVTESDI